MEGIMRVARKHRIPVVEDCAQAQYARIKGRLVGTFGSIAAFSLMFGKHVCTGGQGGMVYTRDEKLYWAARRAADRGKPFGLPAGSDNCVASHNLNLNDLAAAIGVVQLRRLPGIVRRRRAFVARVAAGMRPLRIVTLPPQVPGAGPSYWYLRMRFHADAATCDKATLCKALAAEGVSLRERYVNPAHMYDWYRQRRVFGSSGLPWSSPAYKGNPRRAFPCPNALKALDDHFVLSVYESWGAREARDVVSALRKVSSAYERF